MAEEICSICCEGLEAGKGRVEMSCGHSHHFKCLTSWFINQPKSSCPLCRAFATEMEDFDPTYFSLPPADGESGDANNDEEFMSAAENDFNDEGNAENYIDENNNERDESVHHDDHNNVVESDEESVDAYIVNQTTASAETRMWVFDSIQRRFMCVVSAK